jgi:hypothetical protein
MIEIKQFIAKLIKLTNNDAIRWRRSLLNINSANYNGWEFCIEMPQDDKPYLSVKSPEGKKQQVQSYGLGVEELDNFISCQYKRLGLYENSAHYREELKEIECKRREEDAKRIRDFGEFLKQLCD